jgi:cytochrome c6
MKQQLIPLPFFFFFIQLTSTVGSDRLETGKRIFTSYCNVCHIGGNNIILPEKNLRKKSLEANGMNNLDAIMYQVTNGKNGMPAFGGRLKETEIESVAIYILKEFGKNEINAIKE